MGESLALPVSIQWFAPWYSRTIGGKDQIRAIRGHSRFDIGPFPGPWRNLRFRPSVLLQVRDKDGPLDGGTGAVVVNSLSIFHNGNTMPGGFHFNKQLISRLNALEVEIDFDLYAEGRLFK